MFYSVLSATSDHQRPVPSEQMVFATVNARKDVARALPLLFLDAFPDAIFGVTPAYLGL